MSGIIIVGNCIDTIKQLDDKSVDCSICSPPYFQQRDYQTGSWIGGNENCKHLAPPRGGRNPQTAKKQLTNEGTLNYQYADICKDCGATRIDNQIGLEQSPKEYVEKLVKLFREVRRVLKDDGIIWINIGDSYAGSGKGRNGDGTANQNQNCKQFTNEGSQVGKIQKTGLNGLKPKDLMMIPAELAIALRNDGWYLRNDIIWKKPNAFSNPVKDRCVVDHEYIFMLSKSQKYHFDYKAIEEKAKDPQNNGNGMRRKRTVWSVNVKKEFREAHFATYPEELITPCILAGSRKGSVVLDPFMGAGTTGLAASRNNRDFIGLELNPEYAAMAKKRIESQSLGPVEVIEG